MQTHRQDGEEGAEQGGQERNPNAAAELPAKRRSPYDDKCRMCGERGRESHKRPHDERSRMCQKQGRHSPRNLHSESSHTCGYRERCKCNGSQRVIEVTKTGVERGIDVTIAGVQSVKE
ncbi:hypothetical protein PoB_001159000 [Plakobranchus ocellatus]|uniref:Uncharacterized protein n=1 Tax=Plakobranchus ocellatus TaxID=259542 RepID=A0AAV3YPL4_9GAST|nr:hypothetical protein PoB_001159000 [Plakobranchus ocellatus]